MTIPPSLFSAVRDTQALGWGTIKDIGGIMRYGKPIVPNDDMRKLLSLCVEWYSIPGNEVGGCLHVVLDDDNVMDEDLLYCLNKIDDKKAIAIVEGLQKLSLMQRKWVTYNIYNVKEGEGEREVLEEIEDEYENNN